MAIYPKVRRLKDNASTPTDITARTVLAAGTLLTESIPIQDRFKSVSLLAVENIGGGLGSVTITAEYSLDGTNFFTYYTTSGGALTADAAVVTTLANATRLISHAIPAAVCMRYRILAGANNSQVTLDICYHDDL